MTVQSNFPLVTGPQGSASLITESGRVIATFPAYPGVEVTDGGALRILEVDGGTFGTLSVQALASRFEAASRGNGLGPDGSYAYLGRLHAIVGNQVLPCVAKGNGVIETNAHGQTYQRVILLVEEPFGGSGRYHVGAFAYRCAAVPAEDAA